MARGAAATAAPPPAVEATLRDLRSLVATRAASHAYGSAVFFADKAVSLSDGAVGDVLALANVLYLDGQHRRALHALRATTRGTPLAESDARARHLASLCLAECGEWEDCLALLGEGGDATDAGEACDPLMQGGGEPRADSAASSDLTGGAHHRQGTGATAIGADAALALPGDFSRGAVCLLRARAYEALENRPRAARWYKNALSADPFCYEAFEALVTNQMLTCKEERKLIEELSLRPGSDVWLSLLYSASTKKYDATHSEGVLAELESWGSQPAEAVGDEGHAAKAAGQGAPGVGGAAAQGAQGEQGARPAYGPFATNSDVMACHADMLYSRGDYSGAYDATSVLLSRDPYCLAAMPVHLASALELGMKNELFIRSHKLCEEYPHRAVSWFGVGCYYYCVGNFDSARRYYGKATQMEPSFAPAWMGFGNSFAAQDESDQAMAAYRSANRLFEGCHLPLVAIGMEYQRTNNQPLAAQFFMRALALCDTDPLVYNELGVLHYRDNNFAAAEEAFVRALSLVPAAQSAAWESTASNLGHALRKQCRYAEAAQLYERSLALAPRCAATHAALGFTRHLQGKYMAAVEHYHKALGIRPDDVLTGEMLTIALAEEGLSFRPGQLDAPGAAAGGTSTPCTSAPMEA